MGGYRLALVFACALAAAATARAQQPYPTRPIRLIIPMGAGGATDIICRTLTPKMGELLGQQIVVDNRPGANGVIGDELAIEAAPDGHTIEANALSIAIEPSLYKLPYDLLRDLLSVTQLATIDLVKTPRDLIDRINANSRQSAERSRRARKARDTRLPSDG